MGPHRSASKDPVRVHVELWLVEMDLGERGGRSLPITYAGTEHCSKVSASLKSASGRELEVGKKIHMHQNCIRQSSPKKRPIAYIWAVCLRKSAWIGYYLVRPSICCPDVLFLCNIESGLLPFVCAKIGRVMLPSGTWPYMASPLNNPGLIFGRGQDPRGGGVFRTWEVTLRENIVRSVTMDIICFRHRSFRQWFCPLSHIPTCDTRRQRWRGNILRFIPAKFHRRSTC